jgi:hypothetical protein
MDSKKTLWIIGGSTLSFYEPTFGVWNYNPKTDLFRWLWQPANATESPYNPGVLGLESDLNSPGGLLSTYASSTIDLDDNIWVLSSENRGELWMFNTTSWRWVRIQGLSGQTDTPSFGVQPGRAGADVWPGNVGGNFVTDSHGDLWLLCGFAGQNITNHVWHFNITSKLWRFVSGDMTGSYGISNSTYFAGLTFAGCDIDDNDKIWLFGGEGYINDLGYTSSFADLWSYDTHSGVWSHESGSFADSGTGNVASEDAYDPENIPSSSQLPLLIDRKDGTLLLVSGGGLDTIWLYNITLRQWKLAYGNINTTYSPGVYLTRREPGSTRPATAGIGRHTGLNFDGDVHIVGGSFDNIDIMNIKDFWLIPQDQCSTTTNKCSIDADCIEEMISYSCKCKEGFVGDGFFCSVPPATAVPTITPNAKDPTSNAQQLIVPVVATIFMAIVFVL